MKTLIIQTSPFHTASTFLVNALYGLIPELFDKPVMLLSKGDSGWCRELNKNISFSDYSEDIIVVKTHDLNIDKLNNQYKDRYNLLFICSERKEFSNMIESKYKNYSNVITFDFNELNETIEYSLNNIIDNIIFKIKNYLNNKKLDKIKSISRIELMNKRYEEIKNKPFFYVEPFFEIHGSHRNRRK